MTHDASAFLIPAFYSATTAPETRTEWLPVSLIHRYRQWYGYAVSGNPDRVGYIDLVFRLNGQEVFRFPLFKDFTGAGTHLVKTSLNAASAQFKISEPYYRVHTSGTFADPAFSVRNFSLYADEMAIIPYWTKNVNAEIGWFGVLVSSAYKPPFFED